MTRQAVRLLALLFLLCLVSPTPALAHGEYPQGQQLMFDPANPDVIVLNATYGFVVSRDAGATWEWVCPEAIAPGSVSIQGRSLLNSDAALLFGAISGFARGDSLGCTWSEPSMNIADVAIADLCRDPDVIDSSYALTFDPGSSAGIFRSSDGTSFTRVDGFDEPTLVAQSIRVAPSDGSQMYMSGIDETLGPVVLRSADRGASWITVPIDEFPGEFNFVVLGVAPTDPQKIFLLAQGERSDRIAVSADGGMTFSDVEVLTAPTLAEGRPFGFAARGEETWFGNTLRGLYRIDAGGSVVRVNRDVAASCITVTNDEVWVCSDGLVDDFAIGRSPDGADLQPVLRYEDITLGDACTDGAVAETCGELWLDLQRHLRLAPPLSTDAGVDPDAGTSDGGITVDAAAMTPPPTDEGCSCSGAGGRTGLGGISALAALLLASRLRRR